VQEDGEGILGRVLDSMANGVIAIDREGAIFVFNDAAARLLGVEKGRPSGRTSSPSSRIRFGERPSDGGIGDGTSQPVGPGPSSRTGPRCSGTGN